MNDYNHASTELKTQEQQNKDMPDEDTETVTVHTEVPKEQWEKIKEFVDQHKNTRSYGKKWYAKKAFGLAALKVDEFESESQPVLDFLQDR